MYVVVSRPHPRPHTHTLSLSCLSRWLRRRRLRRQCPMPRPLPQQHDNGDWQPGGYRERRGRSLLDSSGTDRQGECGRCRVFSSRLVPISSTARTAPAPRQARHPPPSRPACHTTRARFIGRSRSLAHLCAANCCAAHGVMDHTRALVALGCPCGPLLARPPPTLGQAIYRSPRLAIQVSAHSSRWWLCTD